MKATCTWGDGPDVLVELKGTGVILYEKPKHNKPPRGDFKHGFITEGSFDLTVEEAEIFGNELLLAAKQAREIISSYCEYMKGEKNGRIREISSNSKKQKEQ